ncbi:YaaR family protein [Ferdinandcohnia quinoae]|uniref:YaaR family protein n=1 Tax=Fredinandcohnia quinoae TaxID=2918902 RepID=A0AAW5ECS1_9BACI|nr:YaaR family protein [Fredinandcohnia sp. SECRCQ15]MCH1626958.1 YaaR family protein [Fredinandcohnia sp. SECRCQ15]
MKINQDFRLSIDKNKGNQLSKAQDSKKFGEIVQQHGSKLQMEQLSKLLSQIDQAGERLARSQTFKDLASYKTLVKRFVNEAVEFGMDIKQSHSWNSSGQGRTLKIVEEIDKELLDLTQNMVEQEKDSINILGKIGIVKGLLINLYT